MGMFDYVKYEANCWKCGHPLTDFQTKDSDRALETLTPKMIPGGNFYTSCDNKLCKAWNEFNVIAKDVEIVLDEKESKLRSY